MSGTAYGVILNDRAELDSRTADFAAAPYKDVPRSPVLYIKPRNTWGADGCAVQLPASLPEVQVGSTLALMFGNVPGLPVAASLAIDVSEPHESLYRPAIRQQCRDGFLPLGRPVAWHADFAHLEITTVVDGEVAHRWRFANLVRPPLALVDEMSSFMTLAAGDLLLVGLPAQPAIARAGQSVRVEAAGLPTLSTNFVLEEMA